MKKKLFKLLGVLALTITAFFGLTSGSKENIPTYEEAGRMNMSAMADTSTLSASDLGETSGIAQAWLDLMNPSNTKVYRYLHFGTFRLDDLANFLNNDLRNKLSVNQSTYWMTARGTIVAEDSSGYQSLIDITFYLNVQDNSIVTYTVGLDYQGDSYDAFESDYVNEQLISNTQYTEDLEYLADEYASCYDESFDSIYWMWFDDCTFIKEIKINNQEKIYGSGPYDASIDNLFLKMLSCTCLLSESSAFPYLDTVAPSIEGDNIYINVDNPLFWEQIKNRFTAHDETDGDLTKNLVFTDNTYILTNGKISCGTYSFKVSVSDNAGNTTTELKYVHVVDYTDPTNTGSTINVSYTKQLTEAEKRALFTYSDNYTPNNQLLFRWVEDNYTINYSELGSYTLKAKVIDQQGNEATAVSTINVIDDVAPFLVVPENLKITTLDDWTLDSFRNYVTATDEKDGIITDFELTDLDGYLNDTKKAGTYRIKVVASDSANNPIEKTFSFLNEDKDMPTIHFDPDYVMVVKKGDKITKEQVINYFIRTGQLTLMEAETIEVVSLYFDEVAESAGFYTLRLMNDYKVIETKLEVIDTVSTSEDPVTKPNNPVVPEDNKFLSTEGYVENFLNAPAWNIYHYITLFGIAIVIAVVGIIIWKKH